MKAILLFIGSVIIWSGTAFGQNPPGSFKVWPGDPTRPQTNRFGTHLEAEQHYDASLETVIVLYAELGRIYTLYVETLQLLNLCLDEAPPEFSGCEDFVDGTNGAVWKPVRDDGRGAVFLLPADYCIPGSTNTSRLSNVRIVDKETGEIATTNHGLRHCNKENQGRLHWNVNLPPAALAVYDTVEDGTKQGLIVDYVVDGDKYECREVPVPSKRYD